MFWEDVAKQYPESFTGVGRVLEVGSLKVNGLIAFKDEKYSKGEDLIEELYQQDRKDWNE